MSELHPLYRYGPIGFVIGSALLSSLLAPRFEKIAYKLKERATDLRLRRYGWPRRTVDGVADGQTTSFIGELASPTAKRFELVLEHAEDTEETVRLAPKLEVALDGCRVELSENIVIEGGSDEVFSGASRWRRLSIGNRVHVTGLVRFGEIEASSFRTNARAVRLVGSPTTPIRIIYAGIPPFRRPRVVKAFSTFAAAISIWAVASVLALLVLLLPTSEQRGQLPGDYVDATLIAHAVPPVSDRAARVFARRLESEGDAKRYAPLGALEMRLQQAAAFDGKPEDTVSRWLRFGYRTRAGKVALGNPAASTCGAGLLAFADAARVGGVAQLVLSCSAFPSDDAAEAAFVIGNFSESRGTESETIVFRQALAPIAGVPCVAGGDKVPPADQPMCVLIHAEMNPKLRRDLLRDLGKLDGFGDRWVSAARALDGTELTPNARWTIDPAALIVRAVPAVMDQPLAVHAELWKKKADAMTPADATWVGLAVAAEQSAFGHQANALALAVDVLDRTHRTPPSDADLVGAKRLGVAIALRAGDLDRAKAWATDADLDDKDELARDLAFALDPKNAESPDLPDFGAAFPTFSNGLTLAEELTERVSGPNFAAEAFVRGGLPFALRGTPEDQRQPLREWLREGFPVFRRAGFFKRAEVLEERLDVARALGDDEMVSDLEPILGRFEAVLLNRTLGLVLRASVDGVR